MIGANMDGDMEWMPVANGWSIMKGWLFWIPITLIGGGLCSVYSYILFTGGYTDDFTDYLCFPLLALALDLGFIASPFLIVREMMASPGRVGAGPAGIIVEFRIAGRREIAWDSISTISPASWKPDPSAPGNVPMEWKISLVDSGEVVLRNMTTPASIHICNHLRRNRPDRLASIYPSYVPGAGSVAGTGQTANSTVVEVVPGSQPWVSQGENKPPGR